MPENWKLILFSKNTIKILRVLKNHNKCKHTKTLHNTRIINNNNTE